MISWFRGRNIILDGMMEQSCSANGDQEVEQSRRKTEERLRNLCKSQSHVILAHFDITKKALYYSARCFLIQSS